MKLVGLFIQITFNLLFFWLVLAYSIEGQNKLISSYGVSDGLSQGFVSDLHQDDRGYLWIGTKNGLNRYDGRRFQEFVRDHFAPNTLTNDYITCIREYKDYLVLGTYSGGINFFHKKTHRVFHYFPGSYETDMVPSILSLEVDQSGNIWVLDWKFRHSGNLYKITVPENFWTNERKGEASWDLFPEKVNDKHLFGLAKGGANGDIFFSNHEGIYQIDAEGMELVTHELNFNLHPRFLQSDNNGRVFISHGSGLLEYMGGEWSNFIADRWIGPLRGIASSGEMVFSNDAGGVFLVRQNQKFGILEVVLEDLIPEGAEIITAICDISGNWWLSDSGRGLHKVSHQSGRFKTYFSGFSISSSLIYDQGGQFFGHISEGIQLNSKEVPPPLNFLTVKLSSTQSNARWSRDRSGNQWFLYIDESDEYVLAKIGANGSEFSIYPISPHISDLGQIYVDEDFVWIGLSGNLYRLEKKSKKLDIFSYRNLLPFKHNVQSIAPTSDGSLWLGTNRGLLQYKSSDRGDHFILINQNTDGGQSILSDDISSLLPDDENKSLWIGTKGSGLHYMNVENKSFSYFTKNDGLPNAVIYGLVPDELNHLWMSTNNGIVRFDPNTGIFRHWTIEDGLPAEEFNTYASGKLPDGRIMFGGVNGLVVFNPADFTSNLNLAQPVINGIRINNQTLVPGGEDGLIDFAAEFTENVRLRSNQNSITFEFAALEFTDPLKNQFRFYLEGAEEAWVHSGFEPYAQYLNLNPGTYTFKLMASNNDGIWNEKYASLEIAVLPPWFQSTVAWMVYIILILSILYTYFRFRINQVQLRSRLELEKQEAQKIRELNEFKTNLFTNITHEFRSPLTIILGTIEQVEARLKDEAINHPDGGESDIRWSRKISLLRRNSEDLLNLVNQMLSLARSEQREIQLNPTNADIIGYMRYLVESFQSLAEQKQIRMILELKPSFLMMKYDPELIRQIIFNLLGNAIKYGPAGSEIKISTSLNDHSEGHLFTISIQNTGVEIPSDDLEHIFDRFYRGGPDSGHSFGSGIGLALTRELLHLMKGEVEVKSGKGQTEFSVFLPFDPEWKNLKKPEALILNNAILEEKNLESEEIYHEIDGAPTLLIVEDNSDVAQFLADTLKDKFNLILAANGGKGLELARTEVPDLIISDVKMPEMDGFELCGNLKEDPRTSHIPIVLLTGKADIDSRIKGLKRGADAYIAKPFYTEELLVTLEKLLENREILRQRYQNFSSNQDNGEVGTSDYSLEDDFMTRLNIILYANLSNSELKLFDISSEIGMGRTNLNKKVHALTGKTALQLLKEFRLNNAYKMLKSGKYNVSEVAFKTGFSDPKYFSRQFKQYFNCSPSQLLK